MGLHEGTDLPFEFYVVSTHHRGCVEQAWGQVSLVSEGP